MLQKKSPPQTLLIGVQKDQRLALDQILYLESKINYTHFHCLSQRGILNTHTLKYFESQLLHRGFLRIHRSYLVNSQHIKHKNTHISIVTLCNGTELTVARRRIKTIFNKLYQPKPV